MIVPAFCALAAIFSLFAFLAVAVKEKKFSGEMFGFTAIFTAILAFWFICVG